MLDVVQNTNVKTKNSPSSSEAGGMDWKEAMNNEHPVPIGLDVGGLWELVDLQYFPELQGVEGVSQKMQTVRSNLQKYINTDYCKYLLHAGKVKVISLTNSPFRNTMHFVIEKSCIAFRNKL